MAADVYTKIFTAKAAWLKALELINIVDPNEIVDVIRRRRLIFFDMKKDL